VSATRLAIDKLYKHWFDRFEYNGRRYKIEYFNGCFHPFVVEDGKPVPTFV
jgi:hypothetical protein